MLAVGPAPGLGERRQLVRLDRKLKFLRDREVGFLVGLEANRTVSITPGRYEQVGKIAHLPQEGLFTHLKGFDFVKVFRTAGTDGRVRHYALYLPERDGCRQMGRELFRQVKAQHWQVEELLGAVKQQCHAQDFFVRSGQGHRKPPVLPAARLPAPHLDGPGQNLGQRLRPPAKAIPAGPAPVYL